MFIFPLAKQSIIRVWTSNAYWKGKILVEKGIFISIKFHHLASAYFLTGANISKTWNEIICLSKLCLALIFHFLSLQSQFSLYFFSISKAGSISSDLTVPHLFAMWPAHLLALWPIHLLALWPAHFLALWPAHLLPLLTVRLLALWPLNLLQLWPVNLPVLWPAQLLALWPAHLLTLWTVHLFVLWRVNLLPILPVKLPAL